MRATGIVRRIDDLGRVVIPKEIRRYSRLKEGDPLEIFTDSEGSIIFRKYHPLTEVDLEVLNEFADDQRLAPEERQTIKRMVPFLRNLMSEIEGRE